MEIFRIKENLETALNELVDKDKFILQVDINERSITHRLAVYLENLFPEWDIDCEYNRNHDDVKRLQLAPENVLSNDTQGKSVYPDIIIHKRNTDENLLIIEMKKSTNRETSDFDIKKINAFKNQLGYTVGLSILVYTMCEEPCYQLDWWY